MKAGDRSNQQPKADKWSVGCPYEGLGWIWGLQSAPRLVLVFLRKPSIFPSPISSPSLGRVPPGSRPSPPSFRKAPFLYTFQGNALTSLVPVTWVFPRLCHRNLIYPRHSCIPDTIFPPPLLPSTEYLLFYRLLIWIKWCAYSTYVNNANYFFLLFSSDFEK